MYEQGPLPASEPARPSLLRDRPAIPAWLMSVILHVGLFIVLVVTLRMVPRQGAMAERVADVGIVLKHDKGEQSYYESEGDAAESADSANSAAESAGTSGLDEILPQESPVDPGDALPANMAVIGVGRPGGGPVHAGQTTEGSGRGRPSFGGGGKTSVFGVPGEGYKFCYVFDRSASMGGSGRNALRAAQEELIRSLGSLEKTHQFQIIFYNDDPWTFNPSGERGKLAFATDQNKERARKFVESITAYGSTQHEAALLAAIRMQPDVIFFLTDADEPKMSASQLYKIHRRAEGITINTIEFGLGPKRGGVNFLQRLAEQNGGGYAYVDITKLFPAGK